ncbi:MULTISPECIES: phosphonate C-P lyase system protein PhnH [unclassified Mesorhizobium]|uniref:phosphonate C-P lyase system protein PhnH n=1 Tax=unclassified Mesorhizobium TaxID=325217 RepID=UPI000F74E9CB|nr:MULTISPECIES: phosphonate C-P lyase system protein PhnH [unclassified Mesorhizobium]AZO03267.1 phosphonate C-P lyase system protein PhnH [Mesorhizobium sp. M2A.F.Ca.ET.043.02.1.1]RUW59459.1 phosphonate C-P lyase system protein PhnH [Mesorhizobium sp. M2A.F.Ca.ET.067.02.1.1]RWB43881.1 MAG: phosphonate C-P lyase system protein PhnH [Mesorhizobium sp.]RWB54927.1 MAG: phosphonate C-P lyase system protein PhnH [Mesorhizobium sp.]RWB80256.1 MAG: phosphonate C-P lyase system protein PhnH [Mesorhiz
MDIATQSIDGGFAEPVFNAQTVFRAIMDAMARPGSVQALPQLTRPPAPLSATAGAVALSLCDNDTPLWLDPPLQAEASVKAWLGFHTGAPLANTPADAHFALIANPKEMAALDGFAQGTQEYPDRSTTLILLVDDLASGPSLLLEGPGIEKTSMIAPPGMPRHFVEQWKQNNQRFPRGVDIILAAPGSLACLPRTTRIKSMEA